MRLNGMFTMNGTAMNGTGGPPLPVRGGAARRLLCAAGLALIFILCPPGIGVAADSPEVETRIKAAFIYNFARFVEWPAPSKPGPVRIGVLGRGEIAAPLEEVVRGKSANGRSIEIARLNSIADAERCEILLIERSESKRVREIVESLAGKPVLTVSDGGNFVRDGVMIVFRMVDESVRFQVNKEAAEHSGIRISSQLLKVAIPAEGKRL